LIRGRHDGCRECTHGLDEFPPRAFGRRRRAAFVEAAPEFQFTIFIIAEELGLTDRPVGARHGLGFIVKIGKRKIMRHSNPLLTDELILRVVRRVAAKPMPSAISTPRVGDKPIDHSFDIGQ
jgi:hypothetical protein